MAKLRINCKQCDRTVEAWPSDKKVYCSVKCRGLARRGKETWLGQLAKRGILLSSGSSRFKKGFTPWNKGLKGFLAGEKHYNFGKRRSDAVKKKISESRKGVTADEKHHQWKGDGVGYKALHDWVRAKLDTSAACTVCAKSHTVQRRHDLANLDHRYTRNLDTWMLLCHQCHALWDAGKLPINLFEWAERRNKPCLA